MFEVAASRWEYAFMASPLAVCLAALVLYGLMGAAFPLYVIARAAQKILCAPGNIFVLCAAPETIWRPETSLLILINATTIVSILVCAAGIMMRHRRGTLVFKRRAHHKALAMVLLVFGLGFAWGVVFYRYGSFTHAIGMGFVSIGAVDAVRFALASLLVPTPSLPPREKLRSGWFGSPLRRASFAPGVETGLKTGETREQIAAKTDAV